MIEDIILIFLLVIGSFIVGILIGAGAVQQEEHNENFNKGEQNGKKKIK